MDITGIHEQHGMLGGEVLLELTFALEEGNAPDVSYCMGPIASEAYDEQRLWFWSQVMLKDTFADVHFWELVSYGLQLGGVVDVPSEAELLEMAYARYEAGNEPGFVERLG